MKTINRIRKMGSFSLSPIRLLLLSISGSLIILVAAIAAVLALWEPRSLQALLPAEGTRALFSQVTREDLRLFTDDYPLLKTVPDFSGQRDLGIVGDTWILSSSDTKTPLPTSNLRLRRQAFLISDAGVAAVLTGTAPRLSSSEEYRALERGLFPQWPRIYLRMSGDEASRLLPEPVKPFLRASGALLLSRDQQKAVMRFFGTPADLSGIAAREIPVLSPLPDWMVSANVRQLFEASQSTLTEGEREVAMGRLSRRVSDLLGGEWSLPYDVLPFLENESFLAWRNATGTGSSGVLVHGYMRDTGALKARLSDMHDRFRSHVTGIDVLSRTFEGGWTSTIVQSDPSRMEEERYALGDWLVRRTGDRPQLLSGISGREFLITNREEWLEDVADRSNNDVLPRLSHPVIAGGRLGASFLRSLLRDVEGEAPWQWIRSGNPEEESVLWSVESDGHVLTLSRTLSAQ